MPKTIWNGDQGDAWTNDTGRHAYQFLASWVNTCGLCAQYDHAVSPTRWPIPLHRSCACRQEIVKVGATARPWVNFLDKAAGLPDAEKVVLVGRANWELIRAGTVKWEDVVTPYRVRSLREVVAIRDLSVDTLVKAGVDRNTAQAAYATVHTSAHDLVARQRQDLLGRLEGSGLTPDQVKQMAATGLAKRLSIGAGPGGPSGAGGVGPPGVPPDVDALFRSLLAGWSPAKVAGILERIIKPPPAAPPRPPAGKPGAMPPTLDEFVDELLDAVKAVPASMRYNETRVWISDAWIEFRKARPDATMAQFKDMLVKANQSRFVTLARSDMPGALSPRLRVKDAASETSQGIATFHWIRIP